jgi:hypothetical protein
MYLRISRAAQQHQEGQVGLLRDPELQLAVNWRNETHPTLAWAERYDPAFERAVLFLEESERQRDLEIAEKERQRLRQLQWTRRLAIILGSAAVVTLAFGLFAMTLKIEADANLKEAITQKEAADAQRREADRQRGLADQQRQRAEDQTVIAGQQRTRAEEQSQKADTERRNADAQRRIAETQSEEALRQKKQAEDARTLEAQARQASQRSEATAIQQKERADTLRVQSEASEAEARRLRMLAVARALAIQTARMTSASQREVSALLALEAYRLHLKNGGAPEDSQIFDALRSGLSRLDPAAIPVLATLPDAVHIVNAAAGGRVLAGGDDGAVWSAPVGAPGSQQRLAAVGSEIRASAWLESPRRLVVGTLDGRVLLVDPGGATQSVVAGPGAGVTALAARGSQLVVGTARGDVNVLDVSGPTPIPRSLNVAGGKAVVALAVLPDGRVAAAVRGGAVVIANPARPDAPPARVLAGRSVRSLAVAPDGAFAAATEEGSILLFVKGPDGPGTELTGHTSAVTALQFSADRTRLASASLDSTIRLWDVEHPDREPIVLAGHTGWVWALDFAPAGQRLVSGGADRTVRSWPTRAGPLADAICANVTRALTPQELHEYTPADIALEPGCPPSRPRTDQ